MITVYNAMLVTLGFLLAALVTLFVMPAYRRRIDRFATERLKRALPLTEAEIRADKDRIRAEYATQIHKLEVKLEEASLSTARQSVEINRREARIHDLSEEVEAKKSSVEENENARRVLEQAIMDRLPKVEQRLLEARRMLQQRDDEISKLADTAGKQTEALEQATQINAQLSGEVGRLTTALETRAARKRESIGDPRFDGEVALRTEIETLRAKTREQGQLLDRLQDGGKAVVDAGEAHSEVEKLKSALARAETELLAQKGTGTAAADDKLRRLEDENRAKTAEISKLKAALKSHEDASSSTNADDDVAALKAEIAALKSETEDKERSIKLHRAEAAASNERLTRQAQHFRDEIRRLSASAESGAGDERRTRSIEAARRSLASRISEPRVPRIDTAHDGGASDNSEAPKEPRQTPYLKAVNGGGADTADAAVAEAPAAIEGGAQETRASPRRTRLLDRISKIDKSS